MAGFCHLVITIGRTASDSAEAKPFLHVCIYNEVKVFTMGMKADAKRPSTAAFE
jgi:hypothetical protein